MDQIINHRRNLKERDSADISCVILHTTGYGAKLQRLDKTLAEKIKAGVPYDLGRAFAEWQSANLEYTPHFTVDRGGHIYQLAATDTVALHTGSGARKRVSAWPMKNHLGKLVNEASWRGLFTTLHDSYATPADLPVWPSPNAVSLGVDLIESHDHVYPAAQIDGLARLLAALSNDFHIPGRMVFTHSMIDPYARTNARGEPWDLTTSFKLQTVLDMVAWRLP